VQYLEILGTELKILSAQLQILGAPTPKEYLTLQKSNSGFMLPYRPILVVLNTTKTNKGITQELSLHINY